MFLYDFFIPIFILGSLMFLFTVFLMPGNTETPTPPVKELTGVDNTVFTHDETNLPTITSLVRNTKRTGTESSRL